MKKIMVYDFSRNKNVIAMIIVILVVSYFNLFYLSGFDGNSAVLKYMNPLLMDICFLLILLVLFRSMYKQRFKRNDIVLFASSSRKAIALSPFVTMIVFAIVAALLIYVFTFYATRNVYSALSTTNASYELAKRFSTDPASIALLHSIFVFSTICFGSVASLVRWHEENTYKRGNTAFLYTTQIVCYIMFIINLNTMIMADVAIMAKFGVSMISIGVYICFYTIFYKRYLNFEE